MKQNKYAIANSATTTLNKKLRSFIHNMDDVVLTSTWHVIQVDETYEPGILKVWALTEKGMMFSVKLRVPRTIYINSKEVRNDSEFKKVQKYLPRGRKAYNVY